MALCRPAFRLLTAARVAPSLLLAGGRSYSTSGEPVGFIGLGNMGGPMANNLLGKGHQLIVYDTVPSAMEPFTGKGVVVARTPAEVAQQTRTLVTMLPAGSNVLECYSGSDGIFSSVQPGSLLIDSSTIETEVSKEVAGLATEKGASFVDAPVSGGVGAAKKGILTFMVGGEEVSFQRAKPLLECMGKNVMHCGPQSTGLAAKICNNMLLAVEMIGVSEAIQLGMSLGLDPKRLSDIINVASGRCWATDVYNPCPGVMEGVPSSNNYEGGFGTSLMTKDLGLALDAASTTKTSTPMGSLARQMYQLLCQHGYAEKDFSSVFRFLARQ